MAKYERGDILSLSGAHTLVLDIPENNKDKQYLTLDLILKPSDIWGEEHCWKLDDPINAPINVIEGKLYTKVDQIELPENQYISHDFCRKSEKIVNYMDIIPELK